MIQSLKLSNIMLRVGLAAVFLWFGIDKFLHPDYWINAWVPQWFLLMLDHIRMSGRDFIYLNGIFEVLIATSLLSNLFTRYFSFAAFVFLLTVLGVHGFSETLIRDIGLMGGFLALIFWPDRRYS